MVVNVHKVRARRRANERGDVWTRIHRRTKKNLGRYRCLLNGREVTNDTFYADGRRGIVRMHLKDAEWRHYFDFEQDGAAWVERRGRVRMRRIRA